MEAFLAFFVLLFGEVNFARGVPSQHSPSAAAANDNPFAESPTAAATPTAAPAATAAAPASAATAGASADSSSVTAHIESAFDLSELLATAEFRSSDVRDFWRVFRQSQCVERFCRSQVLCYHTPGH